MDWDWNAIGSVSTAVAVLVGAYQLRRSRLQAVTDFEDNLSREYREIARSIPVEAHLGSAVEHDDKFDSFYPRLFQYIDLSNEQVFLRMNGRISSATWRQWRDGIASNLSQPAFRRAWDRVKAQAPNRFAELRRLEASGFAEDPKTWLTRRMRFRLLVRS